MSREFSNGLSDFAYFYSIYLFLFGYWRCYISDSECIVSRFSATGDCRTSSPVHCGFGESSA